MSDRMQRLKRSQTVVSEKTDYGSYIYSKKEILLYAALGGAGGVLMMVLFYSNTIMCIAGGIAGAFIYLHIRKKQLIEKRKWQLMTEFGDALTSMVSAMSAGYSMENSITESYNDLKLLYGEERIILTELYEIKNRLELGVPLDELLYELGVRSRVSDIIIFSEVYATARKSGGNLVKVMKRTAESIREKIDIEREINTMIAGKKLESVCMIIIPLIIIVYLRVFSPGFMDPLYSGITGRIFMSVCLVLYLAAAWWSMRIMRVTAVNSNGS
ncbi:MAG: type II secretion system F family protein [Eubacterium sp.]|nr:type II secretion system F family protein [Eubacterium sp.]